MGEECYNCPRKGDQSKCGACQLCQDIREHQGAVLVQELLSDRTLSPSEMRSVEEVRWRADIV